MIRIGATLALLSTSAFSQTIFVDSSATGAATGATWGDAYTDLKAALVAATPGSEVWVAAGTYRPAGPGGSKSESFVLPSDVSVYGGFAGSESDLSDRAGLFSDTILCGDLNDDDLIGFVNITDNSHHVVRVNDSLTNVMLDGFVIEHGNAVGPGPDGRSGGAMTVESPVTVRNITFRTNRAQRWGGAVHTFTGGALNAEDCTFSGNRADDSGGAVHQALGSLVLTDCVFDQNTAGLDGGAIWFSTDAAIQGCTLSDNFAEWRGGGLYNDAGTIDLRACNFYGNATGIGATGYGGGFHNQEGTGLVASSLFVGNTAVLGGGICTADAVEGTSSLEVVSSTVYGNTATSPVGGAGIYSTQIGFHLKNSIVWGNVGPGGTDYDAQLAGSAQLADYACIESMTPVQAAALGTGNISLNPTFLDADGADDVIGTADDNLRLAGGSPCIDAGSNADSVGVADDVDDLPRLTDDPETLDTGTGGPPTIDIGAYEFHNFYSYTDEVSVSAGGAAVLVTQTDPSFAGELYFVMGSASGTHPGLSLAGHTMLLNPDPYFNLTLNNPNTPPLTASFGVLQGIGEAASTFGLPPGMDPILAGLTVHHACAVVSGVLAAPLLTTTPYPLQLVP